jgi:hypothetical protein
VIYLLFANVALFLLDGLLKNFVIHLLMTLSVSMTSVFFVHASDSPGADYRGRVFKLLRRQKNDFKESITLAYIAWRAGKTTLFPLCS